MRTRTTAVEIEKFKVLIISKFIYSNIIVFSKHFEFECSQSAFLLRIGSCPYETPKFNVLYIDKIKWYCVGAHTTSVGFIFEDLIFLFVQ